MATELALDNKILAFLKGSEIDKSENYAKENNLTHEELGKIYNKKSIEKRLKSLYSEDYIKLVN